jgi:hypothetical protein
MRNRAHTRFCAASLRHCVVISIDEPASRNIGQFVKAEIASPLHWTPHKTGSPAASRAACATSGTPAATSHAGCAASATQAATSAASPGAIRGAAGTNLCDVNRYVEFLCLGDNWIRLACGSPSSVEEHKQSAARIVLRLQGFEPVVIFA